MTGATYTGADWIAHVDRVAEAKGWGEGLAAGVRQVLEQLEGYDEEETLWGLVDDGEPSPAYWSAAADYLEGMAEAGLDGAADLAAIARDRGPAQAAQEQREAEASVPGILAGTVRGAAEDVAQGADTAGEALGAAARHPWLVLGGLLALGALALRLRR